MNNKRHNFVLVLFALVTTVMLVRMFILATYDREFLQDRGNSLAQREVSVPTTRGVIYDRSGQPLAVSTPVKSIWTDPGIDTIPRDSYEDLALALHMTVAELERKLWDARDRRFVYLKKRAPHEISEAVELLGIPGVRFTTEYRRYYPAAEVTAHVVGLIKNDGTGAEGLELSHDRTLRGEVGTRRVLRSRDGRKLRDLLLVDPPKHSEGITTTIDLGLQYLAFRHLRETVTEHEAKSATLVLIDVYSGEILALTSYPSYNPNDGGDRAFSRMRNRAVTDTYEPGSTIKTFASLAALETDHFEIATKVDTSPGYFGIGGHLVEDPRNYGELSLEGVLVKSSQVGISKVALKLDKYAVFSALNRAGVISTPHSGLPHEALAHINIEDLERDIGRATLAYGYGLRISPLQLAMGYLTLATGGVRRPVSIIRDSSRSAGSGSRVFDPSDVHDVVGMLEGVVSPIGTAPKANIAGFQVAGKTGTVRKISGGEYDEDRHIAWFVGMAPSSDPRIVAVVMVDEPKGEIRSGGGVSGPVFAVVARHALHLMGLADSQNGRKRDGDAA
ncbi:MAG: penicillin-binding protein 2 [Gammaproteobacteria bacterium]|nr:penicillin-binding protein 2 [Gammaproteobacteria bacterium]